MNPRTVLRFGLGYVGLVSLQLGIWALLAPRSFYDDFPGLGRSWVSADGPYNEHLVRDVGALNLALVVLVVAAAITVSRQLVITAGLASLVWGVPHLIYHLVERDAISGADQIASLGGLLVFVLFAAVVVAVGRGPATEASANR